MSLRSRMFEEAVRRGRKSPKLSRRRVVGKLAGMKLVRDRLEGVSQSRPEPDLSLPVFKRYPARTPKREQVEISVDVAMPVPESELPEAERAIRPVFEDKGTADV